MTPTEALIKIKNLPRSKVLDFELISQIIEEGLKGPDYKKILASYMLQVAICEGNTLEWFDSDFYTDEEFKELQAIGKDVSVAEWMLKKTKGDLLTYLQGQGYERLREVPGRGWCGLKDQAFTTALCYGLNAQGFEGMYHYESKFDAAVALKMWSGEGDPGGNWVKHKGRKEYSNPNYKKPN